MPIIFHNKTKEFHIYNDKISYIFKILENGHPGHIYYGKRLTDRENFGGMIEYALRDMAPCAFEGNSTFSLEHLKQEYPAFGSGDMRFPAFELERADGSRAVDFKYQKHEIYRGHFGRCAVRGKNRAVLHHIRGVPGYCKEYLLLLRRRMHHTPECNERFPGFAGQGL